MNDIHTKDGLIEELRSIMTDFRNKLSDHYTLAGSLSISQYRKEEEEIFKLAAELVFDTVHASYIFDC